MLASPPPTKHYEERWTLITPRDDFQKRLIHSRYWSTSYWELFAMQKRQILVLSIHKTATQSVYRTICDLCPNDNVFHTHFMTTNLRDAIENPEGRGDETVASQRKRAIQEAQIWRTLANRTHQQLVVTVVRDPLARVYSAIFYKHSEALLAYFSGKSPDREQISQLINKKAEFEYQKQKRWYQQELGSLGLDIMQVPCPVNGYAEVTQSGRRLVVLLFEELQLGWSELLKSLGKGAVSLLKQNTASDVGDASCYKRLKEEFALNPRLLEQLYSLPESQHFYGAQNASRIACNHEQTALAPPI